MYVKNCCHLVSFPPLYTKYSALNGHTPFLKITYGSGTTIAIQQKTITRRTKLRIGSRPEATYYSTKKYNALINVNTSRTGQCFSDLKYWDIGDEEGAVSNLMVNGINSNGRKISRDKLFNQQLLCVKYIIAAKGNRRTSMKKIARG